MHCQLRSAEKTLFDSDATMVVAHSPRGEFAVMEGHAPFLAVLDAAPLRIKTSEKEFIFALFTGLLQVAKDRVSILAREAIPAEEIDLAGVRQRRAEIDQELGKSPDDELLRHELVRLAVLERVGARHVHA